LVRYNRPRLEQAWATLLENAREAMPQGGTLDISATADVIAAEASQPNLLLRPGPYVRIDFKDSGAGIPAERLTRIFDPYYSSSKSWGAKKGQGMGLGLALCRSTLLAHGGQITVDSDVGRGSTFHVYLPASDQASGA
jgi:signal transduction histidine kinase